MFRAWNGPLSTKLYGNGYGFQGNRAGALQDQIPYVKVINGPWCVRFRSMARSLFRHAVNIRLPYVISAVGTSHACISHHSCN